MQRYGVFILITILALGAFFRFFRIADAPPGLYPDEAMNGNNALEALATGPPAGGFKTFYPENNGREGLFINLQAVSLAAFGNEPWALRVVSAMIGVLTILSLFLVTKELFQRVATVSDAALDRGAGMVSPAGEERRDHASSKSTLGILNGRGDTAATTIALLSSFFLATSYWHINFSRIGFRAILVPLVTTFALYFLLKGLRTGRISSLAAAGIFTGLGFHTYIAYRIFPVVLAVPIGLSLLDWYNNLQHTRYPSTRTSAMSSVPNGSGNISRAESRDNLQANRHCTPCAVLLFILVTVAVVTPLALHFIQNPEDFASRTGQISIFSAENPLFEYVKSDLLTTGMLFIRGDCNWRHNYNCQPELNPIVAFFFLIGLIAVIRAITEKPYPLDPKPYTLIAWLVMMSLPATLTREGIPHALRAIGMIPPVMILAGLGAHASYQFLFGWIERKKIRFTDIHEKLTRIQKELAVLGIAFLLVIPVFTYRQYFVLWASHPETYFAFSTDLLHLGQYLRDIPPDVEKYVIVNLPGVEVRGIPTPAQTLMFATDTFREEERKKKNLRYLLPSEINTQLSTITDQRTFIALMNGNDVELKNALTQRFPNFKIYAPRDFVALQNF